MKRRLPYKKLLLIVLLLSPVASSSGQSMDMIHTTKIGSPQSVSIDRSGQIYIVDKKGNLTRYLKDGTVDLNFSPQQQGHVALIEAYNPLKIFLFYDDLQQYLFLDRFLTNSESFPLSEISDYSGMVTLSNDNNLWVIDYVDFGLKKYDLNYHRFIIETPFDLLLDPKNHEITFIKEYHNLVFISDLNSGILVFDNLGNYLRKIPVAGIKYFNFSNDNLCYVKEDKLILLNIYNQEKKVINLPEKPLFAFYSIESISLITPNTLKIYKITL